MSRVSRLPLRARLVAGFLAAMLVLLTATGAFVYWRVQYALDRGLASELDQARVTISPLVDPTGHVTSVAAADATGAGWQVLDGTGRVVDSGGPAPATPMVTPRDLASVGGGTRTLDLGSFLPGARHPYRIELSTVGDGRYLLVGVRRDHRDEALRELLLQLSLAGLGALVVAAVVGDLLARAALRPVERYRRRAADIAGGAGGLRLEVPAGRDDEVTRLGHTLNDMLATLEHSLDHERRFINDASHELRTPLTLLKSRIQLARRRARDAEEHEAILDELAVDVARLANLAEQLLALGTEGGEPAGDADLGVVAAVVEQRRLARPDVADQLTLELPTTDTRAAIEPLALERTVTNLVENAFSHGLPPVHLRVAPGRDWVVVQVEDAGPGMPAELLEQATGRFTRAPEARARPGAGLGLSLVEQIVTRAGGELRLCLDGVHTSHGTPAPVPCDHGRGMTASVILPSVPGSTAPRPAS
ncbi:MAG: ATP-binding region, ATPase domain protein [Nocardioides sp.]|nr:ATP-binding region, ATPase domain protein [Nocardioides sp.]